MHNMIPAIAGTGAAPIVRVPAPELAYFKRALDAGAFGVMVPMVETKVRILCHVITRRQSAGWPHGVVCVHH